MSVYREKAEVEEEPMRISKKEYDHASSYHAWQVFGAVVSFLLFVPFACVGCYAMLNAETSAKNLSWSYPIPVFAIIAFIFFFVCSRANKNLMKRYWVQPAEEPDKNR